MFEHLDDPVPPDGAARFDAVVHAARVRRRRRWAYAGSSGVVVAAAVLVSLLVIAPSHGQPSSLIVDEPSPSPSTSATSPQVQPTSASPSPSVSSPLATQGAPAPAPMPDQRPGCPHAAYPADCGHAYWDDGPATLSPASNGTYQEYEKCEQVGPAGTSDEPIPGLRISVSKFDPGSMPAGGIRSGTFSFTNTSTHPVYVEFDYGWSIVDHSGNGLSANALTYSGASGEPGGISSSPLKPGEQQELDSADAATSLVAYGCGDSYADRFPPLAPGDYEAVAWVGWYLYGDAAAASSRHVQASGVWFSDPVPVTVTAASPSPSPSPTGSAP